MRQRRHVTWKDPTNHVAAKRPHPYLGDSYGLNPEDMEPGSLWRATTLHIKNSRYRADAYEQHELPYAYPVAWSYGGDPVIADAGELLLYLGTVRVQEQKGTQNMSVLRHAFLGKAGRFMVLDFTNILKIA